MDEGVFSKIFSAATGVWAIFFAVVVAIFKAWPAIMGRFNERRRDADAAEAGDWERLRAERDHARGERDRIHALWVACEEEKMTLLSRAVAAEAALVGMGVARQQLTILKGIPEKSEGNGK